MGFAGNPDSNEGYSLAEPGNTMDSQALLASNGSGGVHSMPSIVSSLSTKALEMLVGGIACMSAASPLQICARLFVERQIDQQRP